MFLVLDLWHAEATWLGKAKDQAGSNTPRLDRCASVRAIVGEDSIDRAAFDRSHQHARSAEEYMYLQLASGLFACCK
jgi:hypothetical protein